MNKFVIVLIFFVIAAIALGVAFSVYSPFSTDTQFLSASGVVPHHLMAKEIIKDFFEYLSSRGNYKTIVLLSPDHFNRGVLCDKSSFIMLNPNSKEFIDIKVNNSLLRNIYSKAEICSNDSFIGLDHGIMNLLPYIKEYFPESKILPILIYERPSRYNLVAFCDSY